MSAQITCVRDLAERCIGRFEDIVVAKPENEKPSCLKNLSTSCVGIHLRVMNISIDFHDQPEGMTVEVDDKAINDLLSP